MCLAKEGIDGRRASALRREQGVLYASSAYARPGRKVNDGEQVTADVLGSLAAPFLDFPEDQTAALAVGACCRMPGTAWRADPRIARRDADMRAAGLAKGFRAAAPN